MQKIWVRPNHKGLPYIVLPCISIRDCFYRSNLWPLDHMRSTLMVTLSIAIKRNKKIPNMCVWYEEKYFSENNWFFKKKILSQKYSYYQWDVGVVELGARRVEWGGVGWTDEICFLYFYQESIFLSFKIEKIFFRSFEKYFSRCQIHS